MCQLALEAPIFHLSVTLVTKIGAATLIGGVPEHSPPPKKTSTLFLQGEIIELAGKKCSR